MPKFFQYRYERHPGGEVPQGNRSPLDQIAYLDSKGFVAKKERAKLAKKLLAEINKAVKPVVDAMNKDRGKTK